MARKRVRHLLDRLDVVLMRRQLELRDDDPGRAMPVREERFNGAIAPPAETAGGPPAVDSSPAASEPVLAARARAGGCCARARAGGCCAGARAGGCCAASPSRWRLRPSPRRRLRPSQSRWLPRSHRRLSLRAGGCLRISPPHPPMIPLSATPRSKHPRSPRPSSTRPEAAKGEERGDAELPPEVRRWLIEPSPPPPGAPETPHSPSPPTEPEASGPATPPGADPPDSAPAARPAEGAADTAPEPTPKRRPGGWLRRGR